MGTRNVGQPLCDPTLVFLPPGCVPFRSRLGLPRSTKKRRPPARSAKDWRQSRHCKRRGCAICGR
eukprot:scaffold1854_cov113-Isochrysis_galbana.AAC.18